MTASLIRILTAAAVCSLALAVSASAEPSPPATETKPVKLKSFMRKPVATSATRTVKKQNGDYAKVAVKRRAKTRVGRGACADTCHHDPGRRAGLRGV